MISVVTIFILVFSWHSALSCDAIPTVDLQDKMAARDLLDSFQSWGFAYVKGHSLDNSLLLEADHQAKHFFKLPDRVKRQIQADRKPPKRQNNSGLRYQLADFNPNVMKTLRGHTPFRGEQLNIKGKSDLKEVLDVGLVSRRANTGQLVRNKRHYLGENKWPGKGRGGLKLKATIERYGEQCSRVARKVLSLLAEGLGAKDKNVFEHDLFGVDALQVQRLTRYPASNRIADLKDGEIGSGVHTDFGGITVLHADGPGLQILKPDQNSTTVEAGTFSEELTVPHNGQWIEVDSRPGSLIVMGGEALQRLTDGRIFAVNHKVGLTGDKERTSLAFFLDPRPDAILEPMPEFKNSPKGKYKPKFAGHKGVKRNLAFM